LADQCYLVQMKRTTLYPAFATVLQRVCQAIDWDYGEVWVPNSNATLLELSPIWYGHRDRSSERLDTLEKFRVCSENFVLSREEGLPGRIWRSHKVEWISDVSAQPKDYFLRNQLAKAFSLKAGFGFPVFRDQVVVGIFVFFTNRSHEQDDTLIQRALAAAASLDHQEFYVAIN